MLCSEAILVTITSPHCAISRIRNFVRQTASFAASQAATYSGFIVESAMHPCLMLRHTTAPPFRVNIDLDVDFLESLSVWKLESVYPVRIKSLAPYTSM
ncbi:hypothetical protein E5676_scaffold289G00930 [Cucumis melo var. makuwa]|uniref:Uncharacterized protein n=1 Tax=Cucumis melo var. makuwa TaxID=1194695 RepID=A0A5D3DXW8_CUCMM|nr:hypothetical protein E5676_scaffold289G00930 [Cucumis melo var. makuwa]